MNAAIIGASGLIGQLLLQKLIDSGAYHKIFMLGRRQVSYARSANTEVIYIACQLEQLPTVVLPEQVDHGFCCLGTTIKKAASQQAFIAVDKTAVLDFVQCCQARHYFIVTALGANPQSCHFYNKIKGQTEQSLANMLTDNMRRGAVQSMTVFQPSLLLGKRSERRTLESLGQYLFHLLSPFFIGPLKHYQPISIDKVASAILNKALHSSRHHTDQLNKQLIRIANKEML